MNQTVLSTIEQPNSAGVSAQHRHQQYPPDIVDAPQQTILVQQHSSPRNSSPSRSSPEPAPNPGHSAHDATNSTRPSSDNSTSNLPRTVQPRNGAQCPSMPNLRTRSP
ncbi:hypothetical protein [Saccharopolyspora phatthalungensis]|uniref:Uncharacterized protein n=1 Tax=Saccharopolyspora phatthalungensis TaxID=664693 RepID=A0A840QG17_9PSEU|nr:hypothetical protein [Saccharopolyspora phatthalungensis]MBB5157435.1 hypothetical protein [Saccharopolyspora phatthalungensis]